jgi:hypothetical protein
VPAARAAPTVPADASLPDLSIIEVVAFTPVIDEVANILNPAVLTVTPALITIVVAYTSLTSVVLIVYVNEPSTAPFPNHPAFDLPASLFIACKIVSDATRSPDVADSPVNTFPSTAELVTVAAADPPPLAVTSPVRAVIAPDAAARSVTRPASSLILRCLSALST